VTLEIKQEGYDGQCTHLWQLNKSMPLF